MRAFDDYVEGPWGGQATVPAGRYVSRCVIPGDFLNAGDLLINLLIFSPPHRPYESPHVGELETLRISVADSMDPSGVRGYYPHDWGPASIRPRLDWHKEPVPEPNSVHSVGSPEAPPPHSPEPDDPELMPVPEWSVPMKTTRS